MSPRFPTLHAGREKVKTMALSVLEAADATEPDHEKVGRDRTGINRSMRGAVCMVLRCVAVPVAVRCGPSRWTATA